MPLRKHKFIDEFIRESEIYDQLLDKYLAPDEKAEFGEGHPLYQVFVNKIKLGQLISYLQDPDLSPKANCYCGSGRKYGKCCGR